MSSANPIRPRHIVRKRVHSGLGRALGVIVGLVLAGVGLAPNSALADETPWEPTVTGAYCRVIFDHGAYYGNSMPAVLNSVYSRCACSIGDNRRHLAKEFAA